RSTIVLLKERPGFEVSLWAGGMHLKERFGSSIDLIRQDDIGIARELDFLSEPPEPVLDTGRALGMIGAALECDRPWAIMLVGDRTETLAAGLAATLARVPVIHIHGGEESEGAVDNACRHALTKLSHLHLVSHQRHADRIIQMGEDPHAVIVVGAPALDNLYRPDLPSVQELERDLGRALAPPLVLVTMHPTTLGADPEAEVAALGDALTQVAATYLITQPNADAGGKTIRDYWSRFAAGKENVILVDVLGEKRYWALLRSADVLVGNSSSGIIEAPAVGMPVVNVGDRQNGRLRYGQVIDVRAEKHEIASALRQALAHPVRDKVRRDKVYADGPAAPRIVAALEAWGIAERPRKRFYDLPCPVGELF
ncbi:MAG: UDP-N-acetylglucosamine 2-epimerase, partial [Gammaproteobacteria bacterium]